MIVYSATKREFTIDVLTNRIDKNILSSFVREAGHSTGKSEIAREIEVKEEGNHKNN